MLQALLGAGGGKAPLTVDVLVVGGGGGVQFSSSCGFVQPIQFQFGMADGAAGAGAFGSAGAAAGGVAII